MIKVLMQANLDLRAVMEVVRAAESIPWPLRSSLLEVLEYHYPVPSHSRNGRIACSVCRQLEPGLWPCHTSFTLVESLRHPDIPARYVMGGGRVAKK